MLYMKEIRNSYWWLLLAPLFANKHKEIKICKQNFFNILVLLSSSAHLLISSSAHRLISLSSSAHPHPHHAKIVPIAYWYNSSSSQNIDKYFIFWTIHTIFWFRMRQQSYKTDTFWLQADIIAYLLLFFINKFMAELNIY